MNQQHNSINQAANRKNLLLLYYLRWIAIGGQIITILIVHYGLEITLHLSVMGGIIAFLAGMNALTYYYYKSHKIIHDEGLFLTLILDVLALTAQFYYSGGATNPFIGLFLLQVVIAATILPGFYSWLLVGLTLGCYLFLSFCSIEIPHLHHYHLGEFFNLHIHGMFISYGLSACLIAYFSIIMAKNLRSRDASLAKMRERSIAEENILSLGMLAANAAHELGTPLATIAILAGEYALETGTTQEKKRAEILTNEVMRCKTIVSQITTVANIAQQEVGKTKPLTVFMEEIATRWQESHPVVKFHFEQLEYKNCPIITTEYALEQAIDNLLNNAADASPDYVLMQVKMEETTLHITIYDKGKGINKEVMDSIGQLGLTTKRHGLGMGLYLTHAVILRLDGTLVISNQEREGVVAEITLPLTRLVP